MALAERGAAPRCCCASWRRSRAAASRCQRARGRPPCVGAYPGTARRGVHGCAAGGGGGECRHSCNRAAGMRCQGCWAPWKARKAGMGTQMLPAQPASRNRLARQPSKETASTPPNAWSRRMQRAGLPGLPCAAWKLVGAAHRDGRCGSRTAKRTLSVAATFAFAVSKCRTASSSPFSAAECRADASPPPPLLLLLFTAANSGVVKRGLRRSWGSPPPMMAASSAPTADSLCVEAPSGRATPQDLARGRASGAQGAREVDWRAGRAAVPGWQAARGRRERLLVCTPAPIRCALAPAGPRPAASGSRGRPAAARLATAAGGAMTPVCC